MYAIPLNTGTDPFLTLAAYWDVFWAFPATLRILAVVGAAVTLAVVLVGLFPEYGERGARKARRRSVTTTFFGSVVAGLFTGSAGALWYAASQNEIVSMLAAPILFVLIAVGVVWTGIGLVALGEVVAARCGRDGAPWGVAVVAVLVSAGALYPPFGAAVFVVAAVLGFGAGIRTNPFASPSTDRTIPPKRQV